jgi:hypothetical protein
MKHGRIKFSLQLHLLKEHIFVFFNSLIFLTKTVYHWTLTGIPLVVCLPQFEELIYINNKSSDDENRIELNLFTFHWSFTGLSQVCRTCHSTNTVFVSYTTIHRNKFIVVTVIYRLLVLQLYSKIIITRNHNHYYLQLFMIAEIWWLKSILLQSGRSKIGDTLSVLVWTFLYHTLNFWY